MAGGTSVHVVFWGTRPLTHDISCICAAYGAGQFATGSRSGQICIWDLERAADGLRATPLMLFFTPDKAGIRSLCHVKPHRSGDHPKLASLAENGFVRLWDAKEKACLQYCALPPCYSSLKVFECWRRSVSLLALSGECADILLLDSSTLTIVYVLKSDHAPNWLSHVCFLPNVEHKDALLSITADGIIKVWCLPDAKLPSTQEELIEDSSKNFDLTNVLALTAHSHKGFSRMLAVTPYLWKVMDTTAGHLKPLCAVDSEQPKWRGGRFVTMETLLLWTEDGTAVLYQLLSPTPDSPPQEVVPVITILATSPQSDSEMVYNVLTEGHESACIIAGSKNGEVFLWSADLLRLDGEESLPQCRAALRDSWTPPLRPCSLSDTVFSHGQSPSVTCAVHLESIGRLVCGHDDGTIVMFYPAQAATILLLSPKRMTAGWPQHCIMRGHDGRVLTFIYPHAYNSRSCDNTLLLSGGEDFTVRLWNLYTGSLLHTYRAQSGPVCSLQAVPADLAPRYQSCICSVALDYSVAILSIAERNCVFLASCHAAPVECVRWRPLEDFLIVGCSDGNVFVWQMETGSLDRCVGGVAADIILNHSQAPPSASDGAEATALRVINLHTLISDPVIQVLQFNPMVIISLLSKTPELLALPQQRERQQIQSGFRQYLQARRHFVADLAGSDKRSEVDLEMTRDHLAQKVASVRQEQLQGEWPKHIIGIVRLLLSCLHAWGADRDLDRDLEGRVGLIRPIRPITFGLASRGGALSLVLPCRRSVATPPASPQTSKVSLATHFSRLSSVDLASIQDQRWGLSQLLTTQHLLTVVSVANTLMTYIRGAQLLALTASRPAGDSLSEDSEEEDTPDEGTRDNMIRASWSQVTALHCVMLPERQGRHFRAPNLTVLAEHYPDKCVEVREAAQAILQSELRRVGPDGRRQLLRSWSTKLPSSAPTTAKTPCVDEDGITFEECDPSQTSATPIQQYTALIILGVIGAEFCRATDSKAGKNADMEAMESGVARQVAKALQSVILEKPQPTLSLGTSWRRSAVDLMGRGFHLWSSFISARHIIMALLDLCSLCPRGQEGGAASSNTLMGGVARKALSLMVITSARLIIETLSKEVLYFLQSSHIMHFPHSTLHPVPVGISMPTPTPGITTPGDTLLRSVKGEVMLLMDTAVDKCSHEVSIHLVEVVDILLFCVSEEQLRKERNLTDLIPALKRLTHNVSYSQRTRKLAVGSKSGRVCIYDFKHFNCDSINAHASAVTALQLSEDGKLLASYAHGDSALKVWQVGTTMMSVIRTAPKCTHSWPVVSVAQRGELIEWQPNRSVILHTLDGLQHKFSL